MKGSTCNVLSLEKEQWRSGNMFDWRHEGRGFKYGQRHFFLSLSKTVYFSLPSASEGTLSRRSSRPRALVAHVSCN